jgi:hypothetical protein
MIVMRVFVLALVMAAPAFAADPVKLVVAPASVELTGARDRQGLTVQALFADGSTRDVTATAEMTLDKPVATVTNGFLAPAADGTANLTVKHGELNATVPVVVKEHRVTGKLSFRNDVLPVFTKAGCNTGKCHGQAAGKDGFRLSLFGYDPAGDQFRITRQMGGRRVNLATPEDCLLVNKATGKVPHTGGQRVELASESYKLIVRWLEGGSASRCFRRKRCLRPKVKLSGSSSGRSSRTAPTGT